MHYLNKLFILLIIALLNISFVNVAQAKDPIYTSWSNNLAIKGYDTVAYFTEDKAVKGKKEFQTEWMGADWRFSSENNLKAFIESPEKYAPQYGGYCAFAVAQNTTAGIEPTQFTILDGKLYLNYNSDIQKKWTAERDSFIKKANANWPHVLN